jgi:hypothetical protein
MLTQEAKDLFIKMGSDEIKRLGNKEGWGFVGVAGQKVFGEQKGAKVRASMAMSYSKEVKETRRKPSKVKGGSRFEVHSASLHQGSFSKIMINNIPVQTCATKDGCRGLNVVAADAFTHKVLLAKAYDTFENAAGSANLLKDVKGLPEGTIFLVSVKDEASRNLSAGVKRFFSKMGSSHVNALGLYQSWAFVGVKG